MTPANEYRVSERSILRPGTAFRANGGPVYALPDGTEVSCAARGPFVFKYAEQAGETVYLHAFDRDGQHVCLHVAGDRASPYPELVPRPYRIRSVMRKGRSLCRGSRKASAANSTQSKDRSKPKPDSKTKPSTSATGRRKKKRRRRSKGSAK